MDADERVAIAQEFADLWQDLTDAEHDTMLRQNVPKEMLLFISQNAGAFAPGAEQDEATKMRMANCVLAGYILRILEERL